MKELLKDFEYYTIVFDDTIKEKNISLPIECPCCLKEFMLLLNDQGKKKEEHN